MSSSQEKIDRFKGTIEYIRLIDLIQVSCLARLSHVIRVDSGDKTGRFYLDAGKVIHAQSVDSTGEAAFFELLRWDAGCFETERLPEDVTISITRGWEYLLIQALQAQPQNLTEDGEACTSRSPSHGFRGNINNIALPDLIQLICLDSIDRLIEIRTRTFVGSIHVLGGQVSHAVVDGLAGQEAFFKMINAPAGSFKTMPFCGQCERTIEAPWEHLLIEAMRHADERSGEEADENMAESLIQKLQQKNVAEKIRFAMVADKEGRTLLIRDSNRLIQLAVIGNPRITDSEIVAIACSRQVDEEVLRRIAADREWVKIYSVRLGLVVNPKTPVPVSRKFVPTLNRIDLRNISRSKSVPSVIAIDAKRLFSK